MTSSLAVGILSIALSFLVLAANPLEAAEKGPAKITPRIVPTPSGFKNACELGESMATSLRADKGPWAKAQAEKTCGLLKPQMNDEDAASFLRCCVQRLSGGTPPAKPEAPGT